MTDAELIRGNAAPGHNSHPLDTLIAPRAVAVFTDGDEPGSAGRALMANLLRSPFGGLLIPISPGRRGLHGVEAYASLAAAPAATDLAVVATAAARVPAILDECAAAGVTTAVILPSRSIAGGPADAELERQVRRRQAQGSMRILGPGSLGIACPRTGLNVTCAPARLPPGRVAFLSQGGDLPVALLNTEASEHAGCSLFVSLGSSPHVPWAEWLAYLADDPHTECLGVCLERLDNARSFFSAVRDLAAHKPVVLFKSGKHGAEDATGAKIFAEACRCSGVLRVERLADLFRMTSLLTAQPAPTGRRLSILSDARGPAAHAVDSLRAGKGQLATPSPLTIAELGALLGRRWDQRNPIEVGGETDASQFSQAAALALGDPNTDALLVLLTPQTALNPVAAARGLCQAARSARKPLLACWPWDTAYPESLASLRDVGVATFRSPEAAVRSFCYLWQHAENLRCLADIKAARAEAAETADDRGRSWDHCRRSGSVVGDEETRQLLIAYGLPIPENHRAADPEAAVRSADACGYPVHLRLAGCTEDLADQGARIELEAADASAVRRAFNTLQLVARAQFGTSDLVPVNVSPRVPSGAIELALGSTNDPQHGPVIRLGAGGLLARVYSDAVTALAPLTPMLAREMIQDSPLLAALCARCGDESLDGLADVLIRFSRLVTEQTWIREITIDPLLVAGGSVLAGAARLAPEVPPSGATSYYVATES